MQCSYPLPQFRIPFSDARPPTFPARLSRPLARRVSLVDRIVDGIAGLVASGELRDGDPLPSQDELARLFGVSRPSLREALHRMQVLGVVEAKQGRGTFIKDHSRLGQQALTGPVPDYPTVAGLFVTLYDVEPAVAALAAINAEGSGEDVLKSCLKRGGEAASERNLGGFLAHDLGFHSTVAGLSHNRMLAQTVEVARGLLDEAIITSIVTLPTDLTTCVVHHERVADAIFSGDARAAYKAMQSEIDHTLGHNVDLIRELAGAGQGREPGAIDGSDQN